LGEPRPAARLAVGSPPGVAFTEGKIMEIHIMQGGTTNTFCGQPLRLDDEVSNVQWPQAAEANCDDCLGSFISAPAPGAVRVQQYGPEWVAHATAGGNIVDGNLLVGGAA